MKIKVTNRDILEINQGLREIESAPTKDPKAIFALTKLRRKIREMATDAETGRNNVFASHAITQADGSLGIQAGTPEFSDYLKALREYDALETEIDWEPLTMEIINPGHKADITNGAWSRLAPLLSDLSD